jgi:GAF domain-containing protein
MTTPQTAAEPIKRRYNPSQMRLTILNATMYVSAAFTIIVFLSNLLTLKTTGNWWTLAVYIPGAVAVLLAAFFQAIPYRIRSLTLIAFIYIVGLMSLITYGIAGTGRSWLVFVPVLAAILLGLRSGIVFLVISGLTWAVYGYLAQTGYAQQATAAQIEYMLSSGAWITGGFIIVALAAIGAVAAGVLLRHLENALEHQQSLMGQVEQERSNLEQTVEIRTRDIEKRLVQIRTAAEISRAISAYLDPDELLNEVGNLVRVRFNLYYVGVFLLDEFKEYAVLKAGTDEAGQQMLAKGHKLAYGGTSMVGWACQNRQARIALDTGAEAVRFNNPFLPQTRSELALPLIGGDRVLGAMTIQSDQPSAFDENDITLLQGIADSLATALENARLYGQAQANLTEIRELQRQYMSEGWIEAASTNEMTFNYQSPLALKDEEPVQKYDIPLKLRGQVIGKLTVESSHPISDQDTALAEDIANEAAIALENARLLEEIRMRSQHERLVGEITVKAQGSLDLETVVRTSVEELGRTLNAQKIQIRLGEGFVKESQGGNGHSEEGRS